MRLHNREGQKNFRRELRNRPTDAEHLLWYQLRGSRLDGRKFRRQHGIGPYIVDFYCPEEKLAIELDGDIHSEPEVIAHDKARDANLADQGIRVLRFGNEQAVAGKQGTVVEEGQSLAVFEHYGGRVDVRGNLAEQAFGGHVPIMQCRGDGMMG